LTLAEATARRAELLALEARAGARMRTMSLLAAAAARLQPQQARGDRRLPVAAPS
jgi:hypothetical protein